MNLFQYIYDMKTSVVLKSSDRQLFGVTIKQRTKQQFLSITDLQKAYEVARWQHGWTDRRVNNILQTDSVQERVYYLLYERDIIKASLPAFMEMVQNEGIVKVLKGLGTWSTTGRGSDKAVFCDPYVWMLVAMELNPMIYAKVVMWLTDSLVMDRIEAGSEYLPMNSAIRTVSKNPDYGKFAKAINIKVFGHHQNGMRNLASAKELKKIADIEKFITNAIQLGWIKTDETILKAIENYK
jgi:hypothetical protein